MANKFVDLPVPASNGAGAAVDTSTLGATKTIVVGGPFQGSVTIEYANDDAAAVWAPVPNGTFVGNPGRVTIDLAVKWMRAVMASFKGGLANADVGASEVIGGGFFVPLGPAALDISNMPPFKTVVASGACNVEISEDGISWSQAFSFQNKGGQSGTVVAKFARVTGGASAWLGATDLEDDDNEITPPFSTTQHEIFANQTGNDETGTGTSANPYRTFQRAIRDVPNIVPPGQSYVVNITNLGVETLPENYQLPVIQGTFYLGLRPPIPFLFDHVLNIRAFPQLVVTTPPTEAVITDADLYTRAADPDTNLVTITVPGARASWALDAMKGKHLIRTGGPGQARSTTCVIYASTSGVNSTISVCNTIAFIPAVLGAGVEFQIVEPSATLEAPPATNFDGVAIEAANVSSIAFQGIRVRCTVPGNGGLILADCGQPFVELGDFPTGIFSTGANTQFAIFSSVVSEFAGSFDSSFQPRRSLFLNITDWVANCDLFEVSTSVFDSCAELGNTVVAPNNPPLGSGPYPIQGFSMANCLMTGSTGNGIHAQGGKFSLEFVQINGSAGDGINVEKGTNYLTLHHITGTGNGLAGVNVGVRANDGAQVQATDATTTIEGGAAADQVQCGSLAIGTWASAAAGAQYDLPPNAASIAVATGSRIFVRA